MKSAVETLSTTRIKLTVEVDSDEMKPSVAKAYSDIAQQVNIPGFRRGKVPPAIIDKRMGTGVVMQEAINDALPTFYGKAAQEQDVNPIGQPDIEVTEIPDPKQGGNFIFTAEVDVLPTIELPKYEDITVEVEDAEATNEDVDKKLNELRERFGTLNGVERPAKDGDFVSINLTATIDGEEIDTAEGISYQIGAGNMLDGMDEALTGLSADEHTTFTSALRGGEHAGEDAEISVTLVSVKERELPEADDDFAELASQFDTLDELKADLREKAEQEVKLAQIANAQEKFLEQLRDAVSPEVPASLIEQEVTNHLQAEGREDDAEHRKEVEASAIPALQSQLVLDAISEDIEVEVTQEELINHIVASAPQYGMDPQSFANAVESAGQIPMLVGEVRRRKALLLALSEAKVVNPDGDVIDLGLVEEEEEEGSTASDDAKSSAEAQSDDAAKGEESEAGDKPAKKTTAKKAAAKKSTAKKTTAKKAAAKKSTAKKTTAKKSTAKSAAKKTTKSAAKKVASKKDEASKDD